MIATGFGDKESEARKPALANASSSTNNKERKVVHLGTIVDHLDSPTWQRKRQGSGEVETVTFDKTSLQLGPEDEDKFDIPTFLRKQMD